MIFKSDQLSLFLDIAQDLEWIEIVLLNAEADRHLTVRLQFVLSEHHVATLVYDVAEWA